MEHKVKIITKSSSAGWSLLFVTMLCASHGAFADIPDREIQGPLATDERTLPTVVIQEQALDTARAHIVPNLGATSYTLDRDRIESQSQGEFAPFDQTFYRFPGVAQDELDKRLHVRGEEANLQYRINGLLIPDGLSGFGQELSTHSLDSVSLITGTLPAQYGNRTSGIVDLQTKNSRDMQGGTVSIYGGAYKTFAPAIEYAGNSGQFSGYGTASFLHDGLGMANPNDSFRPTHDDTDQFKAFGAFSYLIDANSRLSLILSGANGRFQLPSIDGQVPQYNYASVTSFDSRRVNENQYEHAYYEIIGYQKNLGNVDVQLTQSTRYSDISFKPDVVADAMFNGIATAADHSLVSQNLQADISARLSEAHTLRSGVSVSIQHAQVNTTSSVFPAGWDVGSGTWIQNSSQPVSIVDNYSKTAKLYGAYLQDEWRLSPQLMVNLGVRADLWKAYITEGQISPRLNIVYRPGPLTTWHAGYGRYFTPPPLELVQAGDISKFDNTSGGVDPSCAECQQSPAVKSERYHYFDAGVNHRFTPAFQASLDAYYKIKTNVLDEGQFGPAMMYSPYNGTKGMVRGIELALTYEHRGFSAYGNIAHSRAVAYGLTSGQFQFSAAELAYMQNNWYHLDHDQDWTGSAGIAYRWANTRLYADMLYGSGLYNGYDTHLPGYTTLNVGLVHSVKQGNGSTLKLRFDVTNLSDLKYEIRDGNGIGVFAPQYLPRRAIFAGISRDF
jgi:outer membrane receptor for ferrienterochelin and colicin